MSGFWILGIVINVSLTGLAIWWVLREMKPRDAAQAARDDADAPPTKDRGT